MVRTTRGTMLLIGTGMVLGAALGALLALSKPALATAQAGIQVQDDATALRNPGRTVDAGSALEQSAFISGEVALLGSDAFRDQLRSETQISGAELTVSQVGTSSVVQLLATAPTAESSRRVLEAAIDQYRKDRIRRVDSALTASLTSNQQRLDALRAQGSASAGSTEVARLLAEQSDLITMESNLQRIVPVVAPVTVQEPLGTSPKVLYPAFGMLLGGLATAAVTGLMRQRDLSRTALSTLAMRGRRVLAPVLDLTNATSWSQAIPVILAQLPASSPEAPLRLVNADGCASAETVAAIMQEAASLQQTTRRVGADGRHSATARGWAVHSAQNELSAGQSGSLVIVADSEYTTAGDVELLTDDLRAQGLLPAGVLFVTRAR